MAWLHAQQLANGAVHHSQIALGLGDLKIGREYGPARVCPQRDEAESPDCEKGTITNVTWHIGELTKSRQHHPNPRDAIMLWAAATMFLRVPEGGGNCVPIHAAYHLAHGDVRVNDPSDLKFVVVRIKASKTDPFRKGLSVFLGRTGQILCPVAVNLSYMVQRGGKEGQFFLFDEGHGLTQERFVAEVRKALAVVGIDSSRYAGHSFRIGAATTAAQKGIEDFLIKTLGRRESAAYTLYIWTPPGTLCGVHSCFNCIA